MMLNGRRENCPFGFPRHNFDLLQVPHEHVSFFGKTQHKTIDKPENSPKQLILCVISVHFSQIQAFECKTGPFLDLFGQKSLISDQSQRKSDHLGALHQFGFSVQP